MEMNNLENLIEGKNAVIEALRAGRPIDKIHLMKDSRDRALGFIASEARSAGIPIVDCDRRKLDAMSSTHSHQGVIAVAAAREYCSIEDILSAAETQDEPPFVIICDGLEDPRNLGAVIRCAECAGAHGVIIGKHHCAGLTAAADKASAGAAEHMPVARVANISAAIKELKDHGLWIYGAEANGTASMWKTDMTGPIGLVIGSEGNGISRLVLEQCDFVVSIPMKGKVNSLNASVAGAVLMYEIMRQRSHG